MRHRHELTDAQREKVQDLVPGKASDSGRTRADNRLFVDAVIYVLKTEIPGGSPEPIWQAQQRFFGRMKRFRRVATSYEKKPVNVTGFVWLSALLTQGS